MRWAKKLSPILPLPFWLLSGCDPRMNQVMDTLDGLRKEGDRARQQSTEHSSRLSQIEGFVAYCPDEVKTLLSEVQRDCASRHVCTMKETNIAVSVLQVDPYHQGRFLTLMKDRPHTVFYMPPEGRDLSEPEKKVLRDVVMPTFLDGEQRKTRFLVASNAEDARTPAQERAKKRGARVIQVLDAIMAELGRRQSVDTPVQQPAESVEPSPSNQTRQEASAPSLVLNSLNSQHMLTSSAATLLPPVAASPSRSEDAAVPISERVLHWVFPFYVAGEALRPEDRPKLPTDKVQRSVWVYRVDC